MSSNPGASNGAVSTDWQVPPPIKPFWQRMPHLFRFPAYSDPLLRNLAATAAIAAAVWTEAWLLVLIAALVSTVIIARYGFLVIERTSQGYLKPSDYPKTFEQGSPYRPYKLFAIYLVAGVAIGLLGVLTKSSFLVFLAELAVSLLIPAAVMQLTMTDSFTQSVNPVKLLDIAVRIGGAYLVLCVFLFLLQLGSLQAFVLVAPLFADRIWALVGVFVFVGIYFFLIMSALTGYVMYQYADALGLSVVGPGEAVGTLRRGDHAKRVRDAMIGQMVAAGEIKEAIDLINDELRDRPNDLSLHARLHKLLLIENSNARVDDHTERYLDLLMKSGNAREALPLVEEAFGRKASYEPRNLEHVATLARTALESGKAQLAAQLVRGFDKKHPSHPEIPAVYLVGAQLLMQSGGTEQAKALLAHLSAKYPQHPAAIDGQRMLERIDKLAAPPTLRA